MLAQKLDSAEFVNELDYHIRHRGYSEVIGDVLGVLHKLEQENFVGLHNYWREQREGLIRLVLMNKED
jgi:hypothetical protein